MTKVKIGGNTYPVREHLKAAGATWLAASKTWDMDVDRWLKLKTSKPHLLANVYDVCGTLPLSAMHAASLANPTQQRYRAVGPCRKCQSYCFGDCTA